MNKVKCLGFILGISLFGLVGIVWAQELTLTKIGSTSTVGVDYSVVDHTGAIPSFEGTATPAATVTVNINTAADSTVAGSPSGTWRYTPTSLSVGSNTIVITSGSQSLSFVLNYNATPAATPTATATPTPIPDELLATGVWEYYLPVIGIGLGIIFLGNHLKEKMIAWEGKKR